MIELEVTGVALQITYYFSLKLGWCLLGVDQKI